ncbi:TPA: transposase [Enterococcus faecium]
MLFILSDANVEKIFDILDDRTNFKLIVYFQCFTIKGRQNLAHIVIDMNASYHLVTQSFFPNAHVSINRFHIIQ